MRLFSARHLTLFAIIAALLSSPVSSVAEEHTPLAEEMEAISKAFRTVRREAKDPAKNAANAELVATMVGHAKRAAAHEPALAADIPAAQREAFLAGYRKQMEKFVFDLSALETAFRANDNTKANALIEGLRDLQKESHKEYKKPDEE